MMKRIFALLLAAVLCLGALSACGGSAEGNSGEVAYKVSFVDAVGAPVTSGVVVKFMQNGTQAGMQVVNEAGVAEKTLPKGDYTLELQFTDSETKYKYDESKMSLTGGQTEVEIVLTQALGENKQPLTVGGDELEAYYVTVGGTEITLTDSRSYYLFAPTESGTYEFALAGSDAAIGYYGAPHFVQENSAAEVVDNKFTISVRPDMIGTGNTGTSVLVIGVDAGEGNGVLSITRIGDHQWTVNDEPWITYEATTAPAAYTLPEGAQLGEFDLTAATDAYKLVKDGSGFYHLDSADGALVLVRLGKAATVKYLDPYETVLEHTGVNCYFYEGDKFVKKENYAQCLSDYIACVDEKSGLYPLTDDLMYIIQMNGNQQGWWELDNNYIFLDDSGNPIPGINKDISWLFMCCYIK